MRSILFAAVLVAGLLVAAPPARAANALANGGFEQGLAGWTCSGGAAAAGAARTGAAALAGGVTAGDNGRCAQKVRVLPDTAYTLSAWVRGDYVHLGVAGGPYTWTPSAAEYTKLSVSFTTGPGQTEAEVYLHGWYGAGAYRADDVELDGPGGPLPGVPAAPGAPRVGAVTAGSIALAWNAVDGAAGYRVYEGADLRASATGTSATLTGLDACSTHTYAVVAYNDAGESARSATATGTTEGCADVGLPKHALIGYLHASFANGSGYVRMADVPDAWDVVNLAFGEPTTPTSGDIRFERCPAGECPNVESEEEFAAAVRAKQARGTKVLLSIGGQNG
ncbi:carbohydrate binding domain-containing protein [Actinomadura rifamycini]|uniref:carbohydrate binding domain-containing protein n=1 Tax=Actinomadura rifamycini TaxID=31962 RepID=UPI000412D175|nr:carbohydrate binding domain-containing protein [Actinomadura rifamycini]